MIYSSIDERTKLALRRCAICQGPVPHLSRATCSAKCHEEYVAFLEGQFGKYKKVVDATTGKTYKVPTRHLIEKGLRNEELPSFPQWTE